MIRKRKTKGGAVKWQARVGSTGPLRTFDSKAQAQEYEALQRNNSKRLRAGLALDAGPITYDALCEMYLAGNRSESKEWTENMLRYSRKQYGRLMVRAIAAPDVGRWLAGLPYSPKTKKHILERMRVVMSLGVEWGYLGASPVRPSAVRGFAGKRIEEIRPFESWAEVELVQSFLPTKLDKAFVQFGCATGLRVPGELHAVRRDDVNTLGQSLMVRGTKTTSAPRTIPLSRLALEALDGLELRSPTALLFGDMVQYHYWRKSRWNPALKAAGLAHRPPYQMRHTFATLALSQGVPLDVVSNWMGHKSMEITRTYYAKYIKPTTERYAALLDQMGEAA